MKSKGFEESIKSVDARLPAYLFNQDVESRSDGLSTVDSVESEIVKSEDNSNIQIPDDISIINKICTRKLSSRRYQDTDDDDSEEGSDEDDNLDVPSTLRRSSRSTANKKSYKEAKESSDEDSSEVRMMKCFSQLRY